MKKTTSIHIKGINFIIEEDAYETLQNYMNRLSQKLSNAKDKDEIIEDIELRIAELFQAELENSKEVIEGKDVEKTIVTLGEPEQYIDDEFSEENREENANQHFSTGENSGDHLKNSEKKLYRDLDNASVAGVAAGLASYFHIEAILIRILFVVLVFGGGFGIPLYIILWIVLPSAKSHIDRLRMKGKPITVDSVQEEVELAAERLTKSSRNLNSKMRSGAIRNGVQTVGRLISKLIGGFLLIIGLAMSIFFVVVVLTKNGVLPIQNEDGMLSPYQFMELVLDASQLSQLWWFASIVLLVFIIYVVATAMRFILNMRYPWYKHLSRFTLFAVIVFVIYGFYFGTTLASDFSVESEVKKEIATTTETFTVEFSPLQERLSQSKNVRSRNNAWFFMRDNQIITEDYSIRIRESKDSLFHVYQVSEAHGTTSKLSRDRAKNIQFEGTLTNNKLSVPTFYSFPKKDKMRAQNVNLYIEIPVGDSVTIEEDVYYPEENTYRIYVPNYVNRWHDDWD